MPDSYYLAHCISADFAMGAGIALQFQKRLQTKTRLCQKYGNRVTTWQCEQKFPGGPGECLLEGRVLNLVTKQYYYQKPTVQTMRNALMSMRNLCVLHNIHKIAMPRIGCGLDKMSWPVVSKMVQDVFAGEDIDIVVCVQ